MAGCVSHAFENLDVVKLVLLILRMIGFGACVAQTQAEERQKLQQRRKGDSRLVGLSPGHSSQFLRSS